MSYNFTFFRVIGRLPSDKDFCKSDIQSIGTTVEIKNSLSRLLPGLLWDETSNSDKNFWVGIVTDEETWYEFMVPDIEGALDYFVVRTSHRTRSRSLVLLVCSNLQLVAFDPQTGSSIQPT
jgi:hypothetical protein